MKENLHMQNLDFSPFLRSTVGFDRLFDSLDNLVGQETKSYPPYNIELIENDIWLVSIALAGFSIDDISIETKENSLSIRGAKEPSTDNEDREFLHRGIAERSFELGFQLGDYVEVSNARLENGLLNIELKREVPESKKSRQIVINDGLEVKKKLKTKSVN